jgi:hypothetical protein
MPAHHLFQRGFARAAARRAPLALTLAILAGLSCHDDPVGPRISPTAGFSFVPQFSSSAAMVVDFDRVRIVFTRPGTNQVALDTVVFFPSDADSITLNLAIPVQGVGQSENLSFSLAMINAAGDTVFRGGPNAVTLTAGSTTAPVLVPIRYTGTGANAASVRITTPDTSVFFNDSVVLTAVVLDSANQPIAGTPIEWTSLDTNRATVPAANAGKVHGRTQRGPARIRARLLTGQADTGLVRVQPVPSALALLAGNAQSGTVDATLAQPLAVRVTAVDGLGVVGVRVRFTVVSGGGKVDTLAVTDTTGFAAAQLRLGTLAGPDTVRAAVTGLTGSPVTFVATALPGVAQTLAIAVQPSATAAGSPIAPAVEVAARDTFGNVATASTAGITLAITSGTGTAGAVLGGTLTRSVVNGVATFGNLTIDKAGTGYTLTAAATGLTGAATAAFNVVPGAPTHLGFGLQPGATVAGAPLAPAARVLILDALGNIVTSATDSVTIAFSANPAGGVLAGTLRVAAVAGVADFPSLRIIKAGSGYILAASATGLTGATSGAFSVTVGAAAKLAYTIQPTATIASAAIAPAPQVTVQDSVGNTVTSATTSITLAITSGTGTSGAVLSGTLTRAAVAGVADFPSLAIAKAGTGYTLTATATGVTGAASATFDITVGAAAQIVFATQPPDTVAAGALFGAAAAARDAFGNTVPGATGNVTLTLASNPTGDTLGGTKTQPLVAGVATFSDLVIGIAGAGYTIRATFDTMSVVSTALVVRAGPATALVRASGNGQVDTAGATLATSLVVRVRDADRKSTRLNSSHSTSARMPASA